MNIIVVRRRPSSGGPTPALRGLNAMKNLTRRLALAMALAAPLALGGCGINAIPSHKIDADKAWGEVQNQYQRRADLIPNLVNTVKGYAAQEKGVLIGVTEARAKATQVQADSSITTDPAKFRQFEATQNQLGTALSRLLVVQERYPELKSNENFLALQSQLEGTENRIAIARRDYNDAVANYDKALTLFPTNLWHSTLYSSYQPMQQFQATAAAQGAPTVNFDASSAPAK
jgi:LemA protein